MDVFPVDVDGVADEGAPPVPPFRVPLLEPPELDLGGDAIEEADLHLGSGLRAPVCRTWQLRG